MTPEEQLIEKLSERAEKKTREQREHVEAVAERNQQRLLNIFHEEKVSAYHFQSSTGYGYDDIGRETLDQVYAKIFGTEKAIVRHQFISGTHAITTALFGNLRPGDHLVYAGMPYDTLQTVIGISGNEPGSLSEYDISCTVAPLADDGYPSVEVLLTHVKPETKIVAFQRSKGYAMRPSISIETLRTLIHDIKKARPDLIVFVDNCYGEFVEELEPGHVGADLLAGSLIKNPGGGIAKSGGYIAGNATLVDRAASRFAAPGIGLEGGATSDMLLDMFQGLFLAPHTVSQAVAGALYTSAICEECGLNTLPHYKETRTDLIQAVVLEDRERMIRFCQAIQEASPVDSNVSPYPSSMPGYEDEVIMAGGTFIQGSSIEFSADGPMREPYITYVQGGLTTSHVKIAVKHALVTLIKEGLLRLPASHHGKIN
ncbi:methionine gamma-lyase family protein [Alteribacillus iranensis]|uniref:Cystathionine beta-lyase family protein involved in aluminum resistance n=1 Tax=Alteribacillus iranensis TaxID=930128 RepID=A0A1I2A0S6_9BACI|nr:methionine gamma-lyase family protein [Alteribacillus iranensis]SFE37436.1 Cystathionine beta-lyase family protein involved in aluminum resistance [Alteribacillus iranensis]